MDRLVGNRHLHAERRALYALHARFAIGKEKQPEVLVDWTCAREGGAFYALRFAVPFQGRTLTIYEAVYKRKEMDKASTIREVLADLASVLPADCVPILIMDAGYKNPWFKAIQARVWHWLARVRGLTKYRLCAQKDWHACSDLYANASAKAQAITAVCLAKTNPLSCSLHRYKGESATMHKKKSSAKSKDTNVIKARRRALEPWLLATSLPPAQWSSKVIVSLYRKRMQIEESFRDTKARNGWRFAEMRSNSIHRIENLLLIAAMALWALTVIGRLAEAKNMQKDYQANTVKNRRVLSLPKLGWNLLRRGVSFTLDEIRQSFRETMAYGGA
jgi:hypothetical protein